MIEVSDRDALRAALAANENSPVRRTLLQACEATCVPVPGPGMQAKQVPAGTVEKVLYSVRPIPQ
jgi:hypothetical protein